MGKEQKAFGELTDPAVLKKMTFEELEKLSEDIRSFIVEHVILHGGHLASNLGVVELTLILHRVFNSPEDSLVWDVGHQCYPHKIITGRGCLFSDLRKQGGLSGFPRRRESHHDILDTGHASTAISASLGLIEGKRLNGTSGRVVAIVGDGSMTGGTSFEGMNHAGALKRDLIIVLNDNDMSISPNVGALSLLLSGLTSTHRYVSFRDSVDRAIKGIPKIGSVLLRVVHRFKNAIKTLFFKNNIFTDLGFKYVGPVNGHNLRQLDRVFRTVAEINEPVIVHVITKKGRGYSPAEENPAQFHGVSPSSAAKEESFSVFFGREVLRLAQEEPTLTAITAAMTSGTGLAPFRTAFPERFYDVGIAEGHALTFAAGQALGGIRPLVAVYSTFMQRAVDHLIHDVVLHKLPVIIVMDRAGVVPGDGETHQGIFDIALFHPIPGITLLAPATREEVTLCLEYGIRNNDYPVMIRFPKDTCPSRPSTSHPLENGCGVFLDHKPDADLLIIFTGSLLKECECVAELLKERGIIADLYNLRFIAPLDGQKLIALMAGYRAVLVAEEGIRTGGVGETIVSFVARAALQIQIEVCAIDEVPGIGTRTELLKAAGLDGESLCEAAITLI